MGAELIFKAIGDGVITEKERRQRIEAARASAEARRRGATARGADVTEGQKRVARIAGYAGGAIGGAAGWVAGARFGTLGQWGGSFVGAEAGRQLLERGTLAALGGTRQTASDRWQRFKTGADDSPGAALGAGLGGTVAWLGNRLISNRTGGAGKLLLRDIGLATAGGALGAEFGRRFIDKPPSTDWGTLTSGLGGLALGAGAYALGARGTKAHMAPLQRTLAAGIFAAGAAKNRLLTSTAIPRFAIGGSRPKLPRVGFASPKIPQPRVPGWWKPQLQKRDGHVTEAEREQRREAARARWDKHRAQGGGQDLPPRSTGERVRDTLVTAAPVAAAGLIGLSLIGLARGRTKPSLGRWKDKVDIARRAMFRGREKSVADLERRLGNVNEELAASRQGYQIHDPFGRKIDVKQTSSGKYKATVTGQGTSLTARQTKVKQARKAKIEAELFSGGDQTKLRAKLRERMAPDASEGIKRQRANEAYRASLKKRIGDGVITEAEREQRRNAARARWANRARTSDVATKDKEVRNATAELEPERDTSSRVRDTLVTGGLGALALGGALLIGSRRQASRAAQAAAELARRSEKTMVRSSIAPAARQIGELGRRAHIVSFLARAMGQGGDDLARAAERVKAARGIINEQLTGLKNQGGHIMNQPDMVRGPSRYANEFSSALAGQTTGTRGSDADFLMRMRQAVNWADRATSQERGARLVAPGKSVTTGDYQGQTSPTLQYLGAGLYQQATRLRDTTISAAQRFGYKTIPAKGDDGVKLVTGKEFYSAERQNRTPRGTKMSVNTFEFTGNYQPPALARASLQAFRTNRLASAISQEALDKDIFEQGARAGRRFNARMAERKEFQLAQRGGYTVKPSPFAGMSSSVGGLRNVPMTRELGVGEIPATRWVTPGSRRDYSYNANDLFDRTSPARRGRFTRS